ncbi:MAG: helix-turn-helix transcriptional regulator [Verrucomicrobiota bacterium]
MFTLSPRESEVLTYRERGLSYKEVSERLNISVRTVKFHVQRILRKTKARSSGEAIFLCRQARPPLQLGRQSSPSPVECTAE